MPVTSKWADIQDTGKMDTDTYYGGFLHVTRTSLSTGTTTSVELKNAIDEV